MRNTPPPAARIPLPIYLAMMTAALVAALFYASTAGRGISPAIAPAIKLPALSLASTAEMKPNGSFTVEVYRDGRWVKAAALSYDKFLRPQKLA